MDNLRFQWVQKLISIRTRTNTGLFNIYLKTFYVYIFKKLKEALIQL